VIKEWLRGKLAVTWCRLQGRHSEFVVTSQDRRDLYIVCPECKRRTYGWQLDQDRREFHRPGTPSVQKINTVLPEMTLEFIAPKDRRKQFVDRRKPDRRIENRRSGDS